MAGPTVGIIELSHPHFQRRVPANIVMAGHTVIILHGLEEPRMTFLTIALDVGMTAAHIARIPRRLSWRPKERN
jgi:hypothetical protein